MAIAYIANRFYNFSLKLQVKLTVVLWSL